MLYWLTLFSLRGEYEQKKNSLFFTIAPPIDPPNSLLRIGSFLSCVKSAFVSSNGFITSRLTGAADSALPSKYQCPSPCITLPPLLVTALTTPPSAPPYSAEIPLVLTCTSCRYSNTVFWRDAPFTSELVTMPSTVKAFSAPLAPFTWMPPSTWPWVTDGAVNAIDWNDRPFGMRSNSSALTLW